MALDFGSNWNISTKIRWTGMKFSTDIYVSKTMHGNNFSGPLTFPLALRTPPGYVPQFNPLVLKGSLLSPKELRWRPPFNANLEVSRL